MRTIPFTSILLLFFGSMGLVLFSLAMANAGGPHYHPAVVYVTIGEVQAVHASVRAAGQDVRGIRRFSENDSIETGPDGRGRARLDNGTSIVIDRATKMTASADGLRLDSGRIFVVALATPTGITAGGALALASGSTLAVDVGTDATTFYCSAGELVVRAFGKEVRVRSGESARATASDLKVTPVAVFSDWTGGMSGPWGADGAPRAAVGELWGRLSDAPDSPSSPLAIRNHDVTAVISGEVATTEARTTYFNAGSNSVIGDFRMALPPGAIVSAFAFGTGESLFPGKVLLGDENSQNTAGAKLEWAGEGWLRGTTGTIAPGETATVSVTYVEWLSPDGGHLAYRYPMLSVSPGQVIGEFHATIETAAVDAARIGISPDMSLSGTVVSTRRADFRPSTDLVVDLELRPGSFAPARAYVVPAPDDPAGDYVVVRSELSPAAIPEGVTLALVLDTSRSTEPSFLDAERGLAEALLEGLGKADKLVVFSADERVAPVGPATLGPLDDARKTAIRHALGGLHPSGATNLGVVLEQAAQALPADLPSAAVIYVGDGWPTLGDADVEAMRARLSRGKNGMPRLSAVAVGPTANRFGLTGLARGSGPVFAISDRGDAAQVAVHLLAEALKPTVAGVDVDLGPHVERVYPRGARTVREGDTLTTVGRLKGSLPLSISLRYREGDQAKSDVRALVPMVVTARDDVRRRWSFARVEELVLRGGDREAVVDAALDNSLLTPWTGWATNLPDAMPYRATPLEGRVLDAGLDATLAFFTARLETPPELHGALVPPSDDAFPAGGAAGDRDYLTRVIESFARRTLREATGRARQCLQAHSGPRAPTIGNLTVNVKIAPDGHVRDVTVRSSGPDDDRLLDRCVEAEVRSLSFFDAGQEGAVTFQYVLPQTSDGVPHGCSPTSSLPAALRRGVWAERLRGPTRGAAAYFLAKAQCELQTWADRRTFLELLLDQAETDGRISLAAALENGGDTDAASLVRREVVRRARTPAELESIRVALVGDEPDVRKPFEHDYTGAKDNAARLAVVQRYRRIAPHDFAVRRRELALLEALGLRDQWLAEIASIRDEPFLSADLLGDAASALKRAGSPDESARAFAELVERAPRVPFARAFLGDRQMDEGAYDEATTAYEALLHLVPQDPGALYRLALAHAGGGRLDIAYRMLTELSQTGGRTSDGALQELSTWTAAFLLADARATHPAADEDRRLAERARETPLPDVGALLLVRAPGWASGLSASMTRGDSKSEEGATPTYVPSLGIAAIRIEKGATAFRVKLARRRELEPAQVATAKVEILVLDGEPRLVTKSVPLRNDGKDVELAWDGSNWL